MKLCSNRLTSWFKKKKSTVIETLPAEAVKLFVRDIVGAIPALSGKLDWIVFKAPKMLRFHDFFAACFRLSGMIISVESGKKLMLIA